MTHGIDHFIHGTPARLKRLCAALPAGIEVSPVAGGLVLREACGPDPDIDAAIARIAALAEAHGVDYDGHGQGMVTDGTEDRGRDIRRQTFTARTGIGAGHGVAIPLPDGRFGHAVHLGSDRRGYLLLDISALVTDRPASPEALRDAPRRYRQPILVWHTPFTAMPLVPTLPLAPLPCEVPFRTGQGWPPPEDMAGLERRFAIEGTDRPEGWSALLLAMARAGERLPGLDGYSLWTARIGRSGLLKGIEDHEIRPFAPGGDGPMPWQPSDIDEVSAALAGGPDLIDARDKVT